MRIAMSAGAIDERLRRASELADPLLPEARLSTKIDMTGDGIASRLRQASDLLDLCRALAKETARRPPQRDSSSS
jgi:hypothetical protein